MLPSCTDQHLSVSPASCEGFSLKEEDLSLRPNVWSHCCNIVHNHSGLTSIEAAASPMGSPSNQKAAVTAAVNPDPRPPSLGFRLYCRPVRSHSGLTCMQASASSMGNPSRRKVAVTAAVNAATAGSRPGCLRPAFVKSRSLMRVIGTDSAAIACRHCF